MAAHRVAQTASALWQDGPSRQAPRILHVEPQSHQSECCLSCLGCWLVRQHDPVLVSTDKAIVVDLPCTSFMACCSMGLAIGTPVGGRLSSFVDVQ